LAENRKKKTPRRASVSRGRESDSGKNEEAGRGGKVENGDDRQWDID